MKSSSLLRPQDSQARAGLRLLDAFELNVAGEKIAVAPSAQRLIAFLALRQRFVHRDHLAGMLWLDSTQEHAHANLRSTLWRVRLSAPSVVEATARHVRLDPAVAVDLRAAESLAQHLVADPSGTDVDVDSDLLRHDLLPDWYEDWVLYERERFRQLRLHALDVLADRLRRRGRLMQALELALAAVEAEPFRETAHRTVVSIHLEEGNRSEAVRHCQLYRRVLRDQLGLETSSRRMREFLTRIDGPETVR